MDLAPIEPVRFRHPLQHREPAAGFASRLAAVNGRRMNVFLRDMLIPPRGIDKGVEEHVRTLAAVGGADAAELIRYTPYPAARDRFQVVAGETLGHLAVNRTYFRFCPCCVREDLETFGGPPSGRPWLRLQWTISHFRSCDRHGIYLSVTTPIRRRFEPFDFAETMERYVGELDQLADRSVKAAPSAFQRWLLARIDGNRDPQSWLDRFPLYVAAGWCEALGVSALHPPKVRTSTLTPPMWAKAADEGYRIASQVERAILHLLQKLNDAQRETRGFWGPRDTYGYAYGFLQNTVEDPEFEAIRVMVRTFANRTIPIEPGTNVLGTVINRPRVISVRSGARLSGAHDRTIRRLVDRTGLAGEDTAYLRNHRILVDTSTISPILAKLKGAMSTPKVMELLGIPRLHLRALMTVGALPTAGRTENEPNAKHRFARADVDAMLERLQAGAEPVVTPGPRQMNIMDARHAAGTSLENVLSMIFDERLTWKGKLIGREGYNAILVDADEVTALVRSEPPMINLRKQDVETFIPGMNPRAIELFLGEGELERGMEFSPEARREVPVITRASAEQFRAKYVTMGELCQASGLHHKRVNLLLKGAGIKPAFDPKKARVWIFERSQVNRAVEQRPGFWEYDKEEAQAMVRERGSPHGG